MFRHSSIVDMRENHVKQLVAFPVVVPVEELLYSRLQIGVHDQMRRKIAVFIRKLLLEECGGITEKYVLLLFVTRGIGAKVRRAVQVPETNISVTDVRTVDLIVEQMTIAWCMMARHQKIDRVH